MAYRRGSNNNYSTVYGEYYYSEWQGTIEKKPLTPQNAVSIQHSADFCQSLSLFCTILNDARSLIPYGDQLFCQNTFPTMVFQ